MRVPSIVTLTILGLSISTNAPAHRDPQCASKHHHTGDVVLPPLPDKGLRWELMWTDERGKQRIAWIKDTGVNSLRRAGADPNDDTVFMRLIYVCPEGLCVNAWIKGQTWMEFNADKIK